MLKIAVATDIENKAQRPVFPDLVLEMHEQNQDVLNKIILNQENVERLRI